MNLKNYSRETVPARMPGLALLNVNKSGVLRLNASALKQVGLDIGVAPPPAGWRLMFHQDLDKPRDWYLSLGDEQGFELRIVKEKDLCAQNTVMAKAILNSLDLGTSGSFPIGKEPVREGKVLLWPLITAVVKPNPTASGR